MHNTKAYMILIECLVKQIHLRILFMKVTNIFHADLEDPRKLLTKQCLVAPKTAKYVFSTLYSPEAWAY